MKPIRTWLKMLPFEAQNKARISLLDSFKKVPSLSDAITYLDWDENETYWLDIHKRAVMGEYGKPKSKLNKPRSPEYIVMPELANVYTDAGESEEWSETDSDEFISQYQDEN